MSAKNLEVELPDLRTDHPEFEAHQLAALMRGERAAFWALWERHRSRLYGLCLREMSGHKANAEDALGQAMLKAESRLPAHARDIRTVGPWLARLTRNVCVDFHRECHRREQTAERFGDRESSTESLDEQFLLRDESEQQVERTVATLPSQWRELFKLRVIEEMPCEEIAWRLGLSPENVRKRLQLARAYLREKWAEDGALELPTQPQIARDLAQLDGASPGLGCLNRNAEGGATAQGVARHSPAVGVAGAGTAALRSGWEISAQTAASRTVQVRLPCGNERCLRVFLDRNPVRERQKLQTLQGYLQHHPGSWRKRCELAALLWQRGAWGEAMQAWMEVLKKQPRVLAAAVRLGTALCLTGKCQEGVEVLIRARAHARQPATPHHLTGMIASSNSDWAAAGAAFQKAAELEPRNPAHWHGLAQTRLATGTAHEALKAVEQALRLAAGDLTALSLGYEALSGLGRWTEVHQYLERMLALAPDDLLALQKMLEYHCERTSLRPEAGRQAKWLARRISRLAPGSGIAQEALATYCVFFGERGTGLALAGQFAEQHSHCPRGWRFLARLLARAGRPQEAAAALTRACAPPQGNSGRCAGACQLPELP